MTITPKELNNILFTWNLPDSKDIAKDRMYLEERLQTTVALVNDLPKEIPKASNLYRGWFIGEPFHADNCWKIHASKMGQNLYASDVTKDFVKSNIKQRINSQESEEEKTMKWEVNEQSVDKSLPKGSKSTRQQLLEEAIQCVTKDRTSVHGEPENNLTVISLLWNTYFRCKKQDIKVTGLNATDVAVMMILMKIARTITSPEHKDHWIDIAGYASIGGELSCKSLVNDQSMDLPK